MRDRTANILIILFSLLPAGLTGQTDTDPPVSPVLKLVTVRPETGKTDLEWTKSPSADVAGYVFYYNRNGEGFAFDTIFDPGATGYSNTGSFAEFRIESYVVAAIDSAGNTSPLSNALNTIMPSSCLDTCNRKIILNWNSYPSNPYKVKGYHIFVSRDGEPYSDEATVSEGTLTYSKSEFSTGSNYCFYIMAELEDGRPSRSSKTCIETKMQRPPVWINADFATVNAEKTIDLAFTIDPASEIKSFGIERKSSADGGFTTLTVKESSDGRVVYTDSGADPLTAYHYRLSAINNCGNSVEYSNIAGNIVLNLSESNGTLEFRWNLYRQWRGSIETQRLYIDTGEGFSQNILLSPDDTVYKIAYSDIMYGISGSQACFYINAGEGINIYGISGESTSNIVCSEIIEVITVPTAFTPDNDLINELFRPVLSFTPHSYRLIITDRKNNILFETTEYLSSWDGTKGGSQMAEGAYLWFLQVHSPSGRSFSKTGTVTILRNR
jgi:gliding motility-associated-like protein